MAEKVTATPANRQENRPPQNASSTSDLPFTNRELQMKARIYHNPRCTKSRATLALLEQRGVDLEVVEYLDSPPSKRTLQTLLKKLGLRPRDLIRSGEPEFKESGLTLDAADDELLDLMASIPKLIERPIVEVGSRARVGRPPERVLEILK
jgi:arsenate reductase